MMKSTSVKNNKTVSDSSKPFFNKSGEGSFFSTSEVQTKSFFNSDSVQASMTVGEPDDPYEKEAEKVSGQVVDGFDQATNIQRKFSNLGLQQFAIQPFTISNRISKKMQRILSRTPLIVQAKGNDREEEEKMQQKSMQQKSGDIQFAGDGSPVPANIESKIQSMKGGGQSMDDVTRAGMESSFGADFSGVRVHTNNQAAQLSQDLNAHAFTVGNDIFFNKGRYQPQTKHGAGLLAHELTHTIQQGASVQNKRISNQSLFRSLSAHSAAHLSAMKEDSGLNRKEMAQLEKLPEEEKIQQLQMLQMKGVDKVQKKDNAGTLRRCDGGGSGPAPAPAPAAPIVFSSKSFNTGANGALSVLPTATGVNLSSSPYESYGEVSVKGGTDAEAKDWEAGYIQTFKSTSKSIDGHYIGSAKEKKFSIYVDSPPRRDRVPGSSGEPWYDPDNANADAKGQGRVSFTKTNEDQKVKLWDQPSVPDGFAKWNSPDGKGKLDHHEGLDSFTLWMIVRKKTSPNTIQYLNWASWEVDYAASYNYASKGAKTVKAVTGKTKNVGSGAGQGSDTPTLTGATANNSIKTKWS